MFEWLSERIQQADRVFQEFSLDWTFVLNPPATEAEVRACEVALGVPLPPSYREFLLRYNGARLFCTYVGQTPDAPWWDDSGLIIQGTDHLVQFSQQQEGMFTDQEWQSLIAFCHLGRLRTGDFCAFDPQQPINSEYVVLDCFHELVPADWRQAPIASSFAQWLARIFDQVVDQRKSPEYWLEAESSSSLSLATETPSALFRQGVKKVQRQDYTGAMADFGRVLALDNKNSLTYYERGNVRLALGNYQAAIEDYSQAIRFQPQSVIAYHGRGLALVKLEDDRGAIADFTQALQINSGVAEIYNHRGQARSRLGDRQGAMEDYQKATELSTDKEKITNQESFYDEDDDLILEDTEFLED